MSDETAPAAEAPESETKAYSDGTTATGPGPLPEQSPAQQEAETPTPVAQANIGTPVEATAPEVAAKQSLAAILGETDSFLKKFEQGVVLEFNEAVALIKKFFTHHTEV